MGCGDHGTEATKRQNEKSKHRMASNGRSRRISHRDHGLGACRTGSITGDSFTSPVYQCRRIVSALDVLVQCDLESPSSIRLRAVERLAHLFLRQSGVKLPRNRTTVALDHGNQEWVTCVVQTA